MTTNEKTPVSVVLLKSVLFLAAFAMVAVVGIAGYRSDSREQKRQEKYYPSFERAKAQLQELADNGCQVPFEECLTPSLAMWRVLDAMDREKIAFDTPRGVTPDKLDEIVAQAYVRIASQKLAYLKANGGVKYPSDIALLEDVCLQVYIYKRPLPGGNPTDQELKQLLPPGVTKVSGCNWDEDSQ